MSHYIFFPAILLTIKTTINNVIHVSHAAYVEYFPADYRRVSKMPLFYPALSQPLARVNSDKHKHDGIALISAETLIYWQLSLLEEKGSETM